MDEQRRHLAHGDCGGRDMEFRNAGARRNLQPDVPHCGLIPLCVHDPSWDGRDGDGAVEVTSQKSQVGSPKPDVLLVPAPVTPAVVGSHCQPKHV